MVLVFWVQHKLELVEKVIVTVFLVLSQILLKFLGSFCLLFFLFQVSNNPDQLYILEDYLTIIWSSNTLLLAPIIDTSTDLPWDTGKAIICSCTKALEIWVCHPISLYIASVAYLLVIVLLIIH